LNAGSTTKENHRERWHKPSVCSAFVLTGLSATVLSLVACKPHDFPEYAANYREFAYVTNGGSNTVSVIDVVHVRLDREIQVGQNPTGVSAHPTRNEIYVVNTGNGQSNGSISVIDTEKNAVVGTIPVRKSPYFLEVDAKHDIGYVANSGSNSVSVIDLRAHREISVIGVGEGPGLTRLSPDGKTLVVTNRLGNSVTLVDTTGKLVRSVIQGCPGATDAVILPDSSKAFVACSSGHQIMAIALAHQADANRPARADAMEAMLDVGHTPVQLALKPDGGELFVSNFDSDSISEVVTSTDDVGGSYLMGSRPVRGLVSGDNSLLYVSNFNAQNLSMYGIDDGKRVGIIRVGDGPDAMAFSAGGNLLFVVDARSGDVAVIRTSSKSLFTLLPTGRHPNAITVKAFHTH